MFVAYTGEPLPVPAISIPEYHSRLPLIGLVLHPQYEEIRYPLFVGHPQLDKLPTLGIILVPIATILFLGLLLVLLLTGWTYVIEPFTLRTFCPTRSTPFSPYCFTTYIP